MRKHLCNRSVGSLYKCWAEYNGTSYNVCPVDEKGLINFLHTIYAQKQGLSYEKI